MGSVFKLNLVICWAVAQYEDSNSYIYCEVFYLQKSLMAADTIHFALFLNYNIFLI